MFPPPLNNGGGGGGAANSIVTSGGVPPPIHPPPPQQYNNNNNNAQQQLLLQHQQQQQQHHQPHVPTVPQSLLQQQQPHLQQSLQQQNFRNAQQQPPQPSYYQSQPPAAAAATFAAAAPGHLQHPPQQFPAAAGIPQQYPSSYPPQQQQPQQQQYPHQYPQQYQQQQQQYNNGGYGVNGSSSSAAAGLSGDFGRMSVTSEGFNKLWGIEYVDLLKQRQVVSAASIAPPEIRHQNEMWRDRGASHELFRCTLTKIPETKALLGKSRLPLGILIHPFKDLTQLPVIQCSTIVRCRSCRTYINPFVYFVDSRRWKCNLCFRVNDLPEEFQYDPLTKTYGDPSRRPEVNSGTIEFLAPADYMVRPPQAAVYLFVLETTAVAVETGYLKIVCDSLLENLEALPGDSRTQIGFITFDGRVNFYDLSGGSPQQMSVCDVDDTFVPLPEGLLVSLKDHKEVVRSLLTGLPSLFLRSPGGGKSCLGSAVGVACKLMGSIGGRITVFCGSLPGTGLGGLGGRQGVGASPKELNPGTDYYKKLALDCSSNYIAVDVFFVGDNFSDIASIGCIAKFSGGCVYRFPQGQGGGQGGDPGMKRQLLENALNRYLTRKIGFEAVMRVRCTRGLSIHTFHGNLFVRSTDLLSLPNCNPDAGFGMQVSIDEDLRDFQNVCFQAALLYTSSKGERRIRVHTMCLPVGSTLGDVINSADQQCIVGLLAKMGVDRVVSSSVGDAREAFTNAVVDILSAYATTQNAGQNSSTSGLIAPPVLQVLPTYVHALLRSIGFRSDLKPTVDDRVQFFNEMKSAPLRELIQRIYPDLYPVHHIETAPVIRALSSSSEEEDDEDGEEDGGEEVPVLGLLNLCSDRIDAVGVYVLDQPELIIVYVCRNVAAAFVENVFGVGGGFNALPHEMSELPELGSVGSRRLRSFVGSLQGAKPFPVPIKIMREDSRGRMLFVGQLVEDRGDASGDSPSYYEFLQRVKSLVK